MRTHLSTAAIFVLATLVVAPRPARAVGELTGRIAGTVTAQEGGAPLAGADIIVTGPALVGGPRTLNANEDGSYEVVELPPGVYTVEAGYPGTVKAKRRVEVRQGQTSPLDLRWSAVMEEVKTYNIVEERHPTNPDSTETGAVLTKDQQSKVASGRRYQDLVQQVAGAVDVNGGGNYQIKGGNLTMNHYLVDGLDITDPVTNTFSANINFDSIASEQILTGGFEAEYNSLGGVINLITVAGGDKLSIDSSFYVNNQKFSVADQFGANNYDGVRPFGHLISPTTQSYGANLNVGGPIIRQHLWFNASFEYDYRETSIPMGPPLGVQHPPETSNRFLGRLKLTWAATPKNLVTLSASADPAFFNNVVQDNSLLGVAEDHQNQGGVFAIVQWDYLRSQNLNSNVQLGFQYSTIDFGPQGHFASISNNNDGSFSSLNNTYDGNRPQHFNNDDGTTWYQGDAIQLDRRYTVQFDPSVSVRGNWLGHHDVKVGIQSRLIYHTNHVEVPGGQTFNDAGGGEGEMGLCDQTTGNGCYQRTDQSPFDTHQWGIGAGLYVQDRWKPMRRLTILPGIRFDYGLTKNTRGQTVSSLFGIGPRLGATYALTRDDKTIVSIFYGRSNETLSLLAASSADISAVATTYQWNQAGKTWQLLQQAGGADGYRIGKNLSTPHADEVTASLRREVQRGSMASVTYTYKRIANIWDGIEINQIWNPAGTNVIGYANGMPQQIFSYTTPDSNYRIYQGVDFEYEARPNDNFDFYAGYTLAWLYGPGAEELGQINGEIGNSQYYNPRQAMFYDGFLPEDVRHNVKLRASYSWHGLTGGLFVDFMSGAPLSKKFFNPYDGNYTNLRSPQGTEPGKPNSPTAIAEFRLPDTLTVNARVQYDLSALIKQHVIVIADAFNLFDLDAARSLENRDVPTFGTVIARQTPFRFQIGLRYVY